METRVRDGVEQTFVNGEWCARMDGRWVRAKEEKPNTAALANEMTHEIHRIAKLSTAQFEKVQTYLSSALPAGHQQPQGKICPICDGSGYIGPSGDMLVEQECNICEGAGRLTPVR